MTRVAHGEVVTPELVQDGQGEAASGPASGLATAAAGQENLQAYSFMFGDLQKDEANLLPQGMDTLTQLKKLGRAMMDADSGPAGDSAIPSAYTYLGQFVDHDITLEGSPFGPVDLLSSAGPLPMEKIGQLKNLRHPTLDLDSVYGPTSPPDQNPPHDQAHPGKMRIGRVTHLHGLRRRERGTLRVRLKGDDNDLPRKPENLDASQKRQDRAALIGDPRNDENLIIAQLHLAFLKAHNALVDQGKTFAQARRLLRQHYQHIVVHDFLRRVADPGIVDSIVQHGNHVYDPPAGQFYMPLEFTVAAYRFGHSMVRDSYDFNLNFNRKPPQSPAGLFFLFSFTAFSGQLGTDVFEPTATLPDNWIIEWHRFADTVDTKASNKARRIDTTLAEGLFDLQSLVGAVIRPPDLANLAVRNLLRGYQLRMPTGQAVARQLGLPPLTADQIEEVAANTQQLQALHDGGFRERTPLWYYLLAEAAHRSGGNGQRLGPVGSTIVAEVLIGLIRRSEDSIFNAPGWQPSLPCAHPGRFELADLLRFAGVLPRTYKARANDVLSTIARDQLGNYRRWPEIFVLNWDTMDHHNRDRVRVGQVFLLPGNTPPALRPVLHVTQRGDNLADLAKRYLGDRSRWPEIRDLNVDVLGNHPGPAANPQPPPNTQLVILPP